MNNISRRSFLGFFALVLTCILTGSGFAIDERTCASGNPDGALQMLVVGDSVMWGQGLNLQNKFWFLTQEWLEDEVFAGKRKVCAHVEAHSGASIIDHGREPHLDPLHKYFGEINVNTPTIRQQIKNAIEYYKSQKIEPESVGLVLLNGGANDLTLYKLATPRKFNWNLQKKIKKYCYTEMLELLRETAVAFPNARIVVTGYYPVISDGISKDYVCNLLDTLAGKENVCNKLIVRRGLTWLIQQVSETSRIWYEDSNLHLEAAVNQINRDRPLKTPIVTVNPAEAANRAVFARVNFEAVNTFGASDTYLWKVEKFTARAFGEISDTTDRACADISRLQSKLIIKTNDELYGQRDPFCNCRNLRYAGFNLETCYAAGTGHPNTDGAKEFARAIRYALTKEARYLKVASR